MSHSRIMILAAMLVIVGSAATFLVAESSGANVDGAERTGTREGAALGAAEGATEGLNDGKREGHAEGRASTFKSTYKAAFNQAHKKARAKAFIATRDRIRAERAAAAEAARLAERRCNVPLFVDGSCPTVGEIEAEQSAEGLCGGGHYEEAARLGIDCGPVY